MALLTQLRPWSEAHPQTASLKCGLGLPLGANVLLLDSALLSRSCSIINSGRLSPFTFTYKIVPDMLNSTEIPSVQQHLHTLCVHSIIFLVNFEVSK